MKRRNLIYKKVIRQKISKWKKIAQVRMYLNSRRKHF